ncbi:uncharacterized protein (TIGR00162 family) [Methanolinea mesophila]|uniref:proteasome assembly chaperone family protein n=1 Tax=Methanolinea mesophila TaxID=547055 RepID=UPI001AE604CD|nr:proteasome assembly chaperone family protein [Methanolinea mesophila]MBP1928251.1 uncharacterized protein (TIGR00162 family) [Methanolinea mesophila]
MDDITFGFLDTVTKEELRPRILIEGLPGIGHVGKLVAEHMIQELGAVKVGVIESVFFPPQVIIEENGTVRLANNELFYYPDGERGILFLVGDFQSTSAEGHYFLSDAYLDIAQELGVERIYTLGGYGVGHLVEEPRVLAAVNHDSLREEVENAGGTFGRDEPGGGIVGAAGLLLGMGAQRGMEGICLMGETSGYLVDPKSAASLLRVLTGLLGMEIDPTQLQQRGAEMEHMLQKLIEGERITEGDELRYFV